MTKNDADVLEVLESAGRGFANLAFRFQHMMAAGETLTPDCREGLLKLAGDVQDATDTAVMVMATGIEREGSK